MEILDGFSLEWFLMYRHSKSTFFQVTLNFELEWINICSRHSMIQLKFCSPYCYPLNTLQGVNWKLTYLTHTKEKPSMTNLYFSQNWHGDESQKSVTKFELCLLLKFIYSNSKLLVKISTLNVGTSELTTKRNRLKFLTLHSHFAFLSE